MGPPLSLRAPCGCARVADRPLWPANWWPAAGGRVSGMGAGRAPGGAERVWAEERVTGERSETRVKIKGNAVISNI